MQGRADGRAARANETSSHTVLKPFRSLRMKLWSQLKLWRKWMVTGMKWISSCLPGSFARQRHANSDFPRSRTAGCLA